MEILKRIKPIKDKQSLALSAPSLAGCDPARLVGEAIGVAPY
jgi:hypothetical protein